MLAGQLLLPPVRLSGPFHDLASFPCTGDIATKFHNWNFHHWNFHHWYHASAQPPA